MFIIKPENAVDWQEAMFKLTGYRELDISVWSDETNIESTYIKVSTQADVPGYPEDGMISEHQHNMAEMSFQINWHRGGMICPCCNKERGNYWGGEDGSDTCGHSTFTKPII